MKKKTIISFFSQMARDRRMMSDQASHPAAAGLWVGCMQFPLVLRPLLRLHNCLAEGGDGFPSLQKDTAISEGIDLKTSIGAQQKSLDNVFIIV